MGKNILIPREFLNDVTSLLRALEASEQPPAVSEAIERIERALRLKLEQIERRQAFSEYKTAEPGSDAREQARKAYLDKAGVLDDFISEKEQIL
jgi:hypothetical protein